MVLDELHGLQVTDLVWANELDLNYERGDNEDDFQDLPGRYATIAAFATRLVSILRQALPNTKMHWPAFTPNKDHQCMDYVYLWKDAALRHDVINFHAYDNLENIHTEHTLYAQEFSTLPLALTEFHANGDLEEEKQIFTYLLEQGLESYFFIYEWFNPSPWWSEAFDIAHNPERYDLIMNQASLQEEPDMPTNPNADQPQWIVFAKDGCAIRGIPFDDMYNKQIRQESNWNHYRADGSVLTSPTGSKGLGQLNSRFYPPSDWEDPFNNLTKSMDVMKQYRNQFGSWKKALAAYNWGPANVAGYTKDGLTHPTWDGTRNWRCPHEDVVPSCYVGQMHHYLDVILGKDWAEPASAQPTPTPQPTAPEFIFGFKDLANQLGPAVVGTPLTHEIYPNPDYSYQLTTTGKMEYYKSANKSYFFRAAQK